MVEWAKCKWLVPRDMIQDWHGMKIHYGLLMEHHFDLPDAVGIDPGRNWGMGMLTNGVLTAWWGKLPSMEHDYDYFGYVMDWILDWFPPKHPSKVAIVEGASYGSSYKQPMLEDVRLGFLKSFEALGKEVGYVPPQTVRKAVFGNGRIKASDLWLALNGNGADAAAICLYAGGYREETTLVQKD